MGTLLATIAVCIVLTIVAFGLCRAAGRYDGHVQIEHEISNAEVLSIPTRKGK